MLGFVENLEIDDQEIFSRSYFAISSTNYKTLQIHKNLDSYLRILITKTRIMFTDSKKPRTQNNGLSKQNMIAHGSIFEGDLRSEGDFRIEGTIKGTLNKRKSCGR